MSTKNVYLYKVIIKDTHNRNEEIPVANFKGLIDAILNDNMINDAINLTPNDAEPVIMDIMENNDAYLFAKLNRKKPNNSMQKRNYNDYTTTDVLNEDELQNSGVELFTYCILGYDHGILSIVRSKGAPNEGILSRIFTVFNNRYSLETESVPNQDLIAELLNGNAPEINKIQVDIPRPDAQILQQVFGLNEGEVLNAVHRNTASLVFEVKPEFRGALCDDTTIITQLIEVFRRRRNNYNSVKLSGKPDGSTRQRQYDLYEEYFKYPITVSEYRQEGGRKVEIEKQELQNSYRREMMNIYNDYKEVIVVVCDR